MRAKTQDEFEREVYNIVRDEYSVVGRYISNKKPLSIRHNVCGYTYDVSPNNFLSKNSRCPYCLNRKVMKGFNDVYTTNKELALMLLNEDDRYSYTQMSSVKLDWVCPQCNNIVRGKSPDKVNRYGLMCPFCSDGISYPNKFVHSMFSQIIDQIDNYIAEYSPSWAGRKRYDNYFQKDNKEYILEVDGGLGHGKYTYYGDENQKIISLEVDAQKGNMALEHGICFIRIDADQSDMEYMTNSLLNSELSNILDLSCVNWSKCNIDATKSKKMEVINLFNDGVKNIRDICGKVPNISYDTVYHYLLDGSKGGLCDYNPKDYVKYRKFPKDRGRKVICLNTKQVYNSMTDACREYNIKSISNICSCCTGRYKTSGVDKNGNRLRWMYFDEYNNL